MFALRLSANQKGPADQQLLRPKVQPLVIDTWTNRGPMAGNKSRVARPFG